MRLRAKIRKIFISKFYRIVALCLCSFPRRESSVSEPKKILIIRFGALGETLLTFPLTKVLNETYPGCRITVLTLLRPLWKMNPYVDEIIDFSHAGAMWGVIKGYRTYDVAIDTEPAGSLSAFYARALGKVAIGFNTTNNRGRLFDYPIDFNDQQYEAQTFLDLLSPLGLDPKFDTLVSPAIDGMTHFSGDIRSQAKNCLTVGINLGASLAAPERLWPLENFAELIMKMNRNFKCRFVFFGLKRESQLLEELRSKLDLNIECIDLTSKLSLEDLVVELKGMDIFLSADTGTMHLAAALGVPVFSFFGPNLPVRFAPHNIGSVAFYHDMPCSPCINVHFPIPAHAPMCKGECTRAILPNDVYKVISDFVKISLQK